jgi:bifunctional oligoribonuclease and PAP phosphatase NrnA
MTVAQEPMKKIVELLRGAGRLLAIAHARPDGDALGSMSAMVQAARAAGRQAEGLVPDRVPAQYAFLFDGWQPAAADRFAPLAQWADRVVVLDTCARAQLGTVADGVAACRSKAAAVDHHATFDDLCAVQWIDPSAAATGVMVGELLDALGWPVRLQAAEALTTAAVADTGWLRFANTDQRCLAAVGRWIAAGVRPDQLYQRLYQCDRPQRLRLIARMLATLELSCEGRLACMVLRNADFEAVGALREETENLVNEPLRIGSVDTSVLVTENPDCLRVSLRSRGAIDVAKIAQRFGGGGHPRASGIRLAGDVDQVKRRVQAACAEALELAGQSNIPRTRA